MNKRQVVITLAALVAFAVIFTATFVSALVIIDHYRIMGG